MKYPIILSIFIAILFQVKTASALKLEIFESTCNITQEAVCESRCREGKLRWNILIAKIGDGERLSVDLSNGINPDTNITTIDSKKEGSFQNINSLLGDAPSHTVDLSKLKRLKSRGFCYKPSKLQCKMDCSRYIYIHFERQKIDPISDIDIKIWRIKPSSSTIEYYYEDILKKGTSNCANYQGFANFTSHKYMLLKVNGNYFLLNLIH